MYYVYLELVCIYLNSITIQGEELRVNLAIIESAEGSKWEDALLEAKSPKAKQFVVRTSNELKLLMNFALGNNFLNFR